MKSLEIDMIAGSSLRDTQGETLDLEGADISELEAGRGRLNDNHGKGALNCIGRVTHAKKIFKAEDCEDDRQRYYWEKVKSPYLYLKGQLFNDEDHPNARATAAILRHIHKADCPLKIKASVEGGVISRGLKDPSILARTKIHSCALTFVPANQATLVEPLNLTKSENDVEADMILIKSVLHLAQTNVPSFRHITRAASAEKVEQNISKIMTALGKEVPADLKQELIKASLERKIADNIITINQLVKSIPNPKALWDAAGGASAPHDHPSHQVLKDHWLEQGHPVDESGQLKASSYDALPRGLHDFVKWDKLHPNARPLLSTINNNDFKYRSRPQQANETSYHPGIRGDHQRALDAANHSIRNHLPAFLDGHPELQEHAARLRALPELKTEQDFANATPHIEAAISAAHDVDQQLLQPQPNAPLHPQHNNAAKKSWASVDDAGNKALKGVLASGRDSVWYAGQRAQIGAQSAARAHHLRGNNIDGVSKKLNHDVHEMLWNWASPATSTTAEKSSELQKGSRQRRTPFNPHDQDPDHNLGQWIHHGDQTLRDKSLRMEGNGRKRMLHKLHSQTQARPAADGGVEFLLHRGMGAKEHETALNKEQVVNHTKTSSWTPKLDVANKFADPAKGKKLVSAWIHQDHIRTIPRQLGFDSQDLPEESEHEVVVEPQHKSALHTGIKKALTAGYGGAGSPLGMTGGGVLQSESQELGPKGLNFITCDHCGKEQVYGKFQVKCREPSCGKAFSMNKLEKFFQIRRK